MMQVILRPFVALIAGLLFGFGLALSGMLNPEKVRGFLDIFGNWDPSLAFVLAGAVLVAAIGTLITRAMAKPVLDSTFHTPPPNGKIDASLITGSVLFGIGWGISGLCPGPAIASIGRDVSTIYVFVLAMVAGMLIHAGQASQKS